MQSGTSCHILHLFAEPLLLLWLRLLVIDVSGPQIWLFMSHCGAFALHLVLVGHMHDVDRYSAWISVRDIYTPSWELFWLGSVRMLAAPTGASNLVITTLSHRADITLSPTSESQEDFGWVQALSSVT